MKQIKFTKMHGLGNSYIYVDGRQQTIDPDQLSKMAIAVANPYTGIGSDGLIFMEPSKRATIKMRIFNKDGSEGKNCGNGIRCVAKYAYEHDYTTSKKLTVETLSGIVETAILSHNHSVAHVSVDMGKPILERSLIPMIGKKDAQVVSEPFEINGHKLALTAVSMGNPHAIFFTKELKSDPHVLFGPSIEKDARFPERINVEFVHVETPTNLHMRVWERGSGVTQACGTGACAVAVAAVLNGHSKKGEAITIHLEGGDLVITWLSTGHVRMDGPAVTVATGQFTG